MPKVESFNKELVIQQATEVFHDKGYNATSMQDLVDATGLNRSSIYNSFGNKQHLFIMCLQSYQDVYLKKTSKVLLKANNAIEAIELLLNMYLTEMVQNKKERGCMITNCKSEMANHDKTITSFLLANQKQTIEFLQDLIIDGQNDQLIHREKSAYEHALFLFSSLQGLRMTGILIDDKAHLESIVNTILRTLV